MPNFAIDGSSPTQISQTGTQAALIRNTGSSVVYLDAYSSVSESNYGLELQPLDSVNWAEGRDLWAVCSAGNQSTLSVLYGADGVSLGAVSAVVTGDVTATIDGPVEANIQGTVPVDIQNAVINADVTGNIVVDSGEVNVGGILTPVVIQGGGQGILTASATINAGVTVNVPVTIPGNLGSFYAYRIRFIVTGTAHATQPRILRYLDNYENRTNVVLPSLNDWPLGDPSRHIFTIPAQTPNFNIAISNIGSVSATYVIQVDGVNVAPAQPTTFLGDALYSNDGPLSVTPPTSGSIGNVYLPPSFQGYNCIVRSNSGLTRLVGMNLGYCNSLGLFAVWLERAYLSGNNTINVDVDPASATYGNFGANGASGGRTAYAYVPITGNGRVPMLSFPASTANANSISLMLAS